RPAPCALASVGLLILILTGLFTRPGQVGTFLVTSSLTLAGVLLMAGVLPAPARTDGERPAARTLAG
ncbi:MAG TPA: hypothetical protein VNK89_03865, partial [Thermoflexus sp.]|nr:hypothetical protein [Thermoflexus sp.]